MAQEIAGFLNLLKPPGMTSHDVVDRVRRNLPRKTKVGHLGTLDPAASGVLPLAVGSATRLIPLLPDLGSAMKAYLGQVRLGVSTSTDDLEGAVLETRSIASLKDFREEDWVARLSVFEGAISQVPPQVSAIRQDGQRAYNRVRRGETVDLPARQVTVQRCVFRSWDPEEGRLSFFLVCSSGTYVRSVARDLGETLEVGGALAFLIRTLSGPFALEDAITLETMNAEGVQRHLLPESFPFATLPRVEVEVRERGRELRGDFVPGQRYLAPGGLLTGSPEAGVATVEAVFSRSFA